MSKSDKNVLAIAAVGIGGIVVIGWLQSFPNCDKGCRTQLEHLKDHLMVELVQILLAQFGL